MNTKGQLGIGTFMLVFVAVIVGLTIYVASIQNIETVVNTVRIDNYTMTAPAANGTSNIPGQAVVGTIVIKNATGGETVEAGNFTTANYQVVNGVLTATITGSTNTKYGGRSINLTYTEEPLGYATSSGARSMASLVIIFAALAIAIVALTPTLRESALDLLKR